MAIPVLIIGESGTGKSCSMRNFKKDEIGVINVSRKPLPFKSDIKMFNSDDYATISEVLRKAKAKTIVIDDAQYLQANELMRRAKENGYGKFTDIALNLWNLFQLVINELPEDTIVYFMAHIERDNEGNEKYKTVGKMTDNYSVEGMATICLKTVVKDGHYYFSTQNNGSDTVKSPMNMFDEPLIENDLKAVDSAIRNYYGIGGNK